MEFIEYELSADFLCMGERLKAGIFKPCARTIRYSQITGALRKKFGKENIHAVGYLLENDDFNQIDYLIYSPRDRTINLSKLPLQVEFLTNVRGKIYIPSNGDSKNLPDRFEIVMGALISKGFGRCKLRKTRIIKSTDEDGKVPEDVQNYILNVRLPENKCALFGIKKVIKPIYGYLFEPKGLESGVYVRSLFEGSVVVAPKFLLKKAG